MLSMPFFAIKIMGVDYCDCSSDSSAVVTAAAPTISCVNLPFGMPDVAVIPIVYTTLVGQACYMFWQYNSGGYLIEVSFWTTGIPDASDAYWAYQLSNSNTSQSCSFTRNADIPVACYASGAWTDVPVTLDFYGGCPPCTTYSAFVGSTCKATMVDQGDSCGVSSMGSTDSSLNGAPGISALCFFTFQDSGGSWAIGLVYNSSPTGSGYNTWGAGVAFTNASGTAFYDLGAIPFGDITYSAGVFSSGPLDLPFIGSDGTIAADCPDLPGSLTISFGA